MEQEQEQDQVKEPLKGKEKEKENKNGEKMKALRAAMDKIEKTYGKGSIMKMGDEQVVDVTVISSGSISLNVALGVGGYPRGRVIEIYGPESSGKTTLAIHAIAEAQKAGGVAAFIDAEHAFDRFYAEKLGVNTDELLISQPSSGEEALEIAEQLIRSSAVDIVVIDSVAALTPKKEIAGDSFTIHDIEFCLSEGGCYFVFHYPHPGRLPYLLFSIFYGRSITPYIQPHGSIKLQCISSRGCFGVTEHDAYFLA